jgi:hypothetical protein
MIPFWWIYEKLAKIHRFITCARDACNNETILCNNNKLYTNTDQTAHHTLYMVLFFLMTNIICINIKNEKSIKNVDKYDFVFFNDKYKKYTLSKPNIL